MLVLTRKEGQRLFLGTDIIVTVTRIGDNKVVLGVEAPKSCIIRREELIGRQAHAFEVQGFGMEEARVFATK